MTVDYEQIAAAYRTKAEALEDRAKQMVELAKRHVASSDPNERELGPARQKSAEEAMGKAFEYRAMAASADQKAKAERAEVQKKVGAIKEAARKKEAAKTEAQKKAAAAATEAGKKVAGVKADAERKMAALRDDVKDKSAAAKAAAEKQATVQKAQTGEHAPTFDPNKIKVSVDSIDTAVAASGGEAYAVSKHSTKNAFLLEVDGQKYLYANPAYKDVSRIVQKVSPYDGYKENTEHVASAAIEGRHGQGYVLIGKVEAAVNQQHGRLVEAEKNAKGERIMIHREFNHNANERVKETHGIARPVSRQELAKLTNNPPIKNGQGAVIQREMSDLTTEERRTVSRNLLQDEAPQEKLETMKGEKIKGGLNHEVTKLGGESRARDEAKKAETEKRRRQEQQQPQYDDPNLNTRQGRGTKI